MENGGTLSWSSRELNDVRGDDKALESSTSLLLKSVNTKQRGAR